MDHLTPPDSQSKQDSDALCRLIISVIAENGGWITFSDYMNRVLYTPCLGYYSGVRHKFGRENDLLRPPELTPLFA